MSALTPHLNLYEHRPTSRFPTWSVRRTRPWRGWEAKVSLMEGTDGS